MLAGFGIGRCDSSQYCESLDVRPLFNSTIGDLTRGVNFGRGRVGWDGGCIYLDIEGVRKVLLREGEPLFRLVIL